MFANCSLLAESLPQNAPEARLPLKYLVISPVRVLAALSLSVRLYEMRKPFWTRTHTAHGVCVTEACKVSGELTPDDAMRVHMVQWITAAKAHCAFVVMYNFILAYEETRPRVSADTLRVLHRLVCLHGLCGIDDRDG